MLPKNMFSGFVFLPYVCRCFKVHVLKSIYINLSWEKKKKKNARKSIRGRLQIIIFVLEA